MFELINKKCNIKNEWQILNELKRVKRIFFINKEYI
jgi:hypothetical protein